MRAIYDGKQAEIFERATDLLKDTPYAAQLANLYIAVNIVSTITKKPADLLVGEPPAVDSGKPSDSIEQKRVTSIVEENDLPALIHESVVGAGIRGDSWLKVRYGYAEDLSALAELTDGVIPDHFRMEPVIEHVRADCVFPEVSPNNVKRFRAINIAQVEWVTEGDEEVPYLNVERHLPGYIVYERYKLIPNGVDNTYGVPIETFIIGKKVSTGRIEETGAPMPLVLHIPYTSLDDRWQGEGGIEKVESLLAAINDRLVQIDYILWKHSDPNMYGPPIDGDKSLGSGGRYFEVEKDDVTPGYLVWNSQLEGAFKQLDKLLGLVYQITETPDWLFGTSIVGDGNKVGGTSHTSNAAIRSRYLPIVSKVNRIRTHVDKAIRDAIWLAQIVENFANRDVEGFEPYEPVYPVVHWGNPIPYDEKELAETFNIRTGGKPTIDVKSAIKRLDNVDDAHADEIMARIEEDEVRDMPQIVDSSIFQQADDEDDE